MLLVQEYLQTHSLDQLFSEHGVEARVAGHKASINYSMINAKDDDPVACECRGLILSTLDGSLFPEGSTVVGDTVVLAKPFSRFFNFGQGAAAPIDFNDPELKVFVKLDGSLIIVYFDRFSKNHPNACIATRSVAEADLPMSNGKTFAELFKETILKQTGMDWKHFSEEIKRLVWIETEELTLCFELCTPYNQVVVQHNESKTYLLYLRTLEGEWNNTTLNKVASRINVPTAPVLHHGPLTIEKCLEIVNSRAGKDFEGVVVWSPIGRLKMKNAEYLALHKITSALITSRRSMATLILNGSEDDIIPLLAKQLQDDLLEMKEQIVETCRLHEGFFNKTFVQGISRKDFAIACQQNKDLSMGYLMECYTKGYKSFVDWMKSKKTPEGEYPRGLLDYWCKD